VFVAPGNGGTATEQSKTENVALNVDNHDAVVLFAKSNGIALVVVGPEDPLAKGIVDRLEAEGIACFGPCKKGATLESSKAFSKHFMAKYDIPTAQFASFTDFESAEAYVRGANFRVVVKCSGLAAGKGVLLPVTKEETVEALRAVMVERVFGAAGDEVVLEEFMDGEEVSLLAFCDGSIAVAMPPAQDHKRVFDGDQGPNTGGMGAYAPAPALTPRVNRPHVSRQRGDCTMVVPRDCSLLDFLCPTLCSSW
jgi:phosphoribosylamine--glycine ligase